MAPAGNEKTSEIDPTEEFHEYRSSYWRQFCDSIYGMGGLPIALILFVPRTCLSYVVIGVAMGVGMVRASGSATGSTSAGVMAESTR